MVKTSNKQGTLRKSPDALWVLGLGVLVFFSSSLFSPTERFGVDTPRLCFRSGSGRPGAVLPEGFRVLAMAPRRFGFRSRRELPATWPGPGPKRLDGSRKEGASVGFRSQVCPGPGSPGPTCPNLGRLIRSSSAFEPWEHTNFFRPTTEMASKKGVPSLGSRRAALRTGLPPSSAGRERRPGARKPLEDR